MYYYPRTARDDDPKWRTKLLSQRWILPLAVVSALFFIVGGYFLNHVGEKPQTKEIVLEQSAAIEETPTASLQSNPVKQ